MRWRGSVVLLPYHRGSGFGWEEVSRCELCMISSMAKFRSLDTQLSRVIRWFNTPLPPPPVPRPPLFHLHSLLLSLSLSPPSAPPSLSLAVPFSPTQLSHSGFNTPPPPVRPHHHHYHDPPPSPYLSLSPRPLILHNLIR